MYGREELTAYDCNEGSYDSMGFPWEYKEMVYDKAKADSVMDAMEQRIKELEEENKHLEDYIDAYQKSEAINIAKLDEKDERIKELRESLIANDNHWLGVYHKDIRLKARIKELEANISILETTAPKWISVDDRLPKGSPMLPALTEEGDRIWWGNWHDNNLEIYGITHWLDNAFPPPPTTEDSSAIEKEK